MRSWPSVSVRGDGEIADVEGCRVSTCYFVRENTVGQVDDSYKRRTEVGVYNLVAFV